MGKHSYDVLAPENKEDTYFILSITFNGILGLIESCGGLMPLVVLNGCGFKYYGFVLKAAKNVGYIEATSIGHRRTNKRIVMNDILDEAYVLLHNFKRRLLPGFEKKRPVMTEGAFIKMVHDIPNEIGPRIQGYSDEDLFNELRRRNFSGKLDKIVTFTV